MKTLSGAHYEKVSGQTLLGDTQRGYLFKNDFFYIDNNSLKCIDIVSRKTFTISNLEMEVGTDQLPRQIGYVDDRVVYFSTIEYGKNLPVNKQLSHAVISKVMRQTEKIEKLNIECGSPFFSVHQKSIYFTAMNGEIHTYEDGSITALGVKGSYPYISPDGRKVVFVSFGLINTHVFLYDLINRKHDSLISFFGPKSVDPIIR